MMNSQQPDEGDFPPNPFLSSPDDGVGDFRGAEASSSAAAAMPAFAQPPSPMMEQHPTQHQRQQHQGQEPLPMPVPPAPHPTSSYVDPGSASFAPVEPSPYVGSGAMDSGAAAPMAAGGASGHGADGQQLPPVGGSGPVATVQRCFSVDTYRAYFDVDTADVQNRIVASILTCNVPDGFRHNVLGVNNPEGKGPDLYGPFWITVTLIFSLAVTSNMHSYLHDTKENFEADIFHLIHSLWVLCTFAFVLPALFFLVFRCLSIQMPLMELVSLYGYGLVPYYPAAILCLIPAAWVEWIALLVATGVSCLLVLRNVAGPILSSDVSQQKAGPLLGCVMGCHIIFFLTLKFTFYHHKPKEVAAVPEEL